MASVDPPTPLPKRIVICCDGTWQSAVSGEPGTPSNITRLAQSISKVGVDDQGKTWQQVVWYDSGVGTTSSWVGKRIEGAVGAGLDGNVIEAYNFVVLNWSPGDQVFCFGFSRGAYTARTIAGLISDIGICEPRNMSEFPDLWKQYRSMDGERFCGSDADFAWTDGQAAEKQEEDLGYRNHRFVWERRPKGAWASTQESRQVELVGVFDTVGAIGLPSVRGFQPGLPAWIKKGDPKFHNVKLNGNIKRAFQALALDEHREAFAPTLYHLPDVTPASDDAVARQEKAVEEAMVDFANLRYDQHTPMDRRLDVHKKYNEARRELIRMHESRLPQPELLQVWFPGVHINVGGGSSDTLKNEGDMEEMANITFGWMLDQIRPYLAIQETTIYQEYCRRREHIDALNAMLEKYKQDLATQKAAQAKESYFQSFRRLAADTASYVAHPFGGGHKDPDTRRRDYGWGTGAIIDSYTALYVANGSQARTPGQYATDAKHAAPGATHEQVHPSVGYRMHATEHEQPGAKARYTPLGMERDVFFRREGPPGQATYSINGVVLPEYVFKKRDAFGAGPSFETLAVEGDLAREYLEKAYGVPVHEW